MPTIMPETHAVEKIRSPTEGEKQIGYSVNCLFGGIGVLLCLTGIGAIVGIPLLLGTYWASKAGKQPIHVWEAPCPFCGTVVSVPINTLGSNCPACRKRFILRGNNFVGVE